MLKVVETESIADLLQDGSARERIMAKAPHEFIFLTRQALEPDLVRNLISYLSEVGRNSLPNRIPTLPGCLNHHRVFQWDELSYVKGSYHQFSFFPWNKDIFEVFELFRPIYRVRNLLNGLAPERYLGPTPEDDCIGRIAFQFYPRGKGAMNKHQDPVDIHQKIQPILIMTKRGHDFEEGGLYYEAADGTRVYVDEIAEPGDVVWACPQIPHGVEQIDPGAKPDWLSFRGRWSALVAVNKMLTNTNIADAVDLESARA